jgi:signal transduction histidine kinase
MDFIEGLFDTSNWPARWQCGVWSPLDGWLYIFSDLLTFLSYMAIPIILWYFLRNSQNDIPFRKMVWLFVLFIFFCGLTHLAEVVIFWYPFYRFSALLRLFTGLISLFTVIQLYRILPEALKFQSPRKLEEIVEYRTYEIEIKSKELGILINSIPEIIFRVDSRYNMLFANDAYYKQFNEDGIFFKLANIDNTIFSEETKEKYKTSIDKAIKSKQKVSFEYESSIKSNVFYSIDVVPEVFDDEANTVLCIATDISDFILHQKKLENLIKDKENITRIIAHDIKSPLGTVQSLSQLYKNETDSSSINEVMLAINKSSEGMLKIVKELLELSLRNEEIGIEEFDFPKYFEEYSNEEKKHAISKNIEINFTNNFKGNIKSQKIVLNRILDNLISNAIKFSHRNSKIDVKASKQNGHLQIVVKDYGVGMSESLVNDLFLPNKNISRQGTEGESSTGIGLYLVKEILDKINGKISVKSKLGEGSEFLVEFPIV